MKTEIEQLKCGGCGEEKHLLYQRENGEIIAECIKCQSTSQIIVTQPEIKIYNNSGQGTLCIFE